MRRVILIFSAVFIITSLMAVIFLGLSSASIERLELDGDLSKLQKDYDALRAKYYALLGNYSGLKSDYQGILLQAPENVPNPGSVAPDEHQILSRYQALQQMYISLQDEFNQYKADYQKLKGMTDLRLMQGDLKALITPDDPEVVSLVRNITGKVGNASAPDSYWKDIKAMYDWVTANIKYREDGLYPKLPDDPADALTNGLKHSDQMAQFANETLHLREGDCEDMAILLTSMIRAYFNKQFMVESIWVTGAAVGDVAIVIPFSKDKIVILNPTRGYYSHDTFGDLAPNDISREIYSWLNIWRPTLGNDVHVYRVFSDYMDKYFSGTEDYITWMYNR